MKVACFLFGHRECVSLCLFFYLFIPLFLVLYVLFPCFHVFPCFLPPVLPSRVLSPPRGAVCEGVPGYIGDCLVAFLVSAASCSGSHAALSRERMEATTITHTQNEER